MTRDDKHIEKKWQHTKREKINKTRIKKQRKEGNRTAWQSWLLGTLVQILGKREIFSSFINFLKS